MAGGGLFKFQWHIIPGGSEPNITDVFSTFHASFEGGATPTDADVDDVLDSLETWWGNNKDQWNAEVVLKGITGQKIRPTPAALPRQRTLSVVGTRGSGPPCPPNCSIVFSYATGTASRRGRGRMYMPAPPTGITSASGFIATVHAGSYADAAKDLCDEVNGAGVSNLWNFAVFSPTDDTFRTVVQAKCGTRIDTQRRRLMAGPEAYEVRTVS